MSLPALPAASPASNRRGWQRLAVLAAGAVTAAGALAATAAPATAGPTGSAWATSLGASSLSGQPGDLTQPCGPLYGYCPSHPDRAVNASTQDCRGPFSGSGGRTCDEPAVSPTHATSVTVQDCARGPLIGSGGVISCGEPTANPAWTSAAAQVWDDGGGFKGGGA